MPFVPALLLIGTMLLPIVVGWLLEGLPVLIILGLLLSPLRANWASTASAVRW